MKVFNRLFVALMVVLSVFAIQSCGGSQNNNSTEQSSSKMSPAEIVNNVKIDLPMDMGEGLTLSAVTPEDECVIFTVTIPSPVSIDEFRQALPLSEFTKVLAESYKKDLNESDPLDKLSKLAVDNGYSLVFRFDNTEDSIDYVLKPEDLK